MDTRSNKAASKRSSFLILFLLVLLLFGATRAWALNVQSEAAVLSVQVSRSQIRAYPSALAPILATLVYGEQVRTYEASSEGWVKVYLPGSTRLGYMFVSALSRSSLDGAGLKPAEQGFSGSEIALAGKGFSESAEQAYRQSSDVDYAPVDAMEDFEYSQDALVGFLEGLSP
ncbi:MAG: SH3 domain-containing protein [Spirochaetia bacterium]|jgi:hypothetical protein|nr:SH3 domain-containing protein [Spirochaetia bacterium]